MSSYKLTPENDYQGNVGHFKGQSAGIWVGWGSEQKNIHSLKLLGSQVATLLGCVCISCGSISPLPLSPTQCVGCKDVGTRALH